MIRHAALTCSCLHIDMVWLALAVVEKESVMLQSLPMKSGVLHSDMACVLQRHVRSGTARQNSNSGKTCKSKPCRPLRHGSFISACLQEQQIISRQGPFHLVLSTNISAMLKLPTLL